MILKKILCGLGTFITVVLVMVSALLKFSLNWMDVTWEHLTMDEIIYHLKTPLDGTNTEMVEEYLNLCVVPMILLVILLVILLAGIRGKRRFRIIVIVSLAMALFNLGLCVNQANQEIGLLDYLFYSTKDSTFIEDNYVSPSDTSIVFPEKKRNLIYIFMESMENTYTDEKNGGAFKENVIPELTQISMANENFSGKSSKLNGGISMVGTGWTMGALFGQTSGLPLQISISGNYMNTQDSFFSDVITLGDILEEEGYTQIFMLGSNATFGGRRLYFKEHGSYRIRDYRYAKKKGLISEDYKVFWGYEDKKLFEFAKDKLMTLSRKGEPFNLTLLTVDTHFEDGYVCDLCPDTFEENQYANVFACSSKQISDFVYWVQQQDFYENTTIVLVGDHPTMDSDFCEDVDKDYLRKVYTTFINADAECKLNTKRIYSTFDMFPTTLAALGVNIDGDKLGLGTNLFSSEQTLVEEYDWEKVNIELKKNSEFMKKLADVDLDSEKLREAELKK